jgi:outer membrane protein
MLRRTLSLVLAVGICHWSLTQAQIPPPPLTPEAVPTVPARTLDLIMVHQRAHKADPVFLSAEATYRANQKKLPQAWGALLPNVSARAERANNDQERIVDSVGNISNPPGKAKFQSHDYSLDLRQPIFNAEKFSSLRQAKAEVRQAEANYAAAKQDLIVRAAEIYFGVLGAQDNLDFAQAEQRSIARQLEVAQGRLDVGLATITEVHEARARYETAVAQTIEADNLLADNRQRLMELIGPDNAALIPLGEYLPLITPDPPNINRWVETAFDQNLALKASREGVEVARQEIKKQQAGHYPRLDLVGSRTRHEQDESISTTGAGFQTDNTSVGVELNVPLFEGGAVRARAKEARYLYQAAQHDFEGQRRNTERTARASFLGVSSASARVEALKQAVVANESAVEAKQEGFNAGINTNLDVLDAQRDLFRAKRDYARARYDYVINILKLKQSAGTLSEDDLEEMNRWLLRSRQAPTN